MNIDDLIVEVRDSNLSRVGRILPQDLVGFTAVLRFNNVGTWEIPALPDTHPLCDVLRSPGSGIIVTGPDGVLISGPTISATNSVESGQGSGTWAITGVDDSVLLGERLAYPTPTSADVTAQTSAYDTREDLASTVMLGYVEANLGDGVAPVERAVSNLVFAVDPLAGSTVKKSARFDILGELLSEIASVDALGFDIRQNGDFLEFSVFEPVDRSLEIRMDVANNTLSRTEYAYGRPNATLAIVAGQGVGADRQFVEVTTSESDAAETLWERRIETFIDQRNTDDVLELEQAGLEKLATDGVTVTSIDIVPSSDITMAYGVDFNLGDVVGVTVGSQEVSAIVTTVSLSIQTDGVRVGATVGDASGVDFEALTAKKSTETQRRVNSLERKESSGGSSGSSTVSVGTTTTGAPGSSASVSNSGTSTNAVLNFTIPRGETGTAGATGPAGPANSLSIGTVTTGSSGSPASATITGTAPSQTLNLTLPAGNDGVGTPVGSVLQYAGSTAPSGFLLAQGQSLSTTTYASLFAVIGYTYGGSGANFNLPDLQTRVPVGKKADNTGTFGSLNAKGGAATHTLSTAEIPSHSHANTATTDSQGGHNHTVTVSGGAHTHILPMAASGAFSGVNDKPLRASGGSDGNFRTDFEATGSNYGSSAGTHSHSTSVSTNGAHTHNVSLTNASTGGGGAHNNLQPYIVLNYIIKT